MTYECAICLNINHVSRLHCRTCGTIPANYSPTGTTASPARQIDRDDYQYVWFNQTLVARGADRTEHHRNVRVNLRTALADYSE